MVRTGSNTRSANRSSGTGWPPRARTSRLHPDFLRYFFLSASFNDQVDQLKQGIGIQHWGPSHLGQVKLPLPSPEEQVLRLQHLAAVEETVRQGERSISHSVLLLEELKSSLISSAVAGELDATSASSWVVQP